MTPRVRFVVIAFVALVLTGFFDAYRDIWLTPLLEHPLKIQENRNKLIDMEKRLDEHLDTLVSAPDSPDGKQQLKAAEENILQMRKEAASTLREVHNGLALYNVARITLDIIFLALLSFLLARKFKFPTSPDTESGTTTGS
jgi:hypothetical protein